MSGAWCEYAFHSCPAFWSTEPLLQTLWTSQNQCSACGSSCGHSHFSLMTFLEETFAQGKEKDLKRCSKVKGQFSPITEL